MNLIKPIQTLAMRFGGIAWLVLLNACGGGSGSTTSNSANSTPTDPNALSIPLPSSKVNFTISNADFPNPERGFYRFAADLTAITASDLNYSLGLGYRLVYAPTNLSAWQNQDLPQSQLDTMSAGFAKLRQAGLKVILRFAYNYPSTAAQARVAQDAPLPQIQAHIAQLAPLLQANADVIAVWQAGFIGAWGEWHTSSNGLTTAANKQAVRDALLAVLPEGRNLQFRYSEDLLNWYSAPPVLSDLQQTSVPTRAKVGLHNDCFLAGNDDVGTYSASTSATNTAQLRNHIQSTTKISPFGGETCAPQVAAQARMTCADILNEGAAYSMSYLNKEYYKPFIDAWTAGACMSEISSKLGYRMELQSLHFEQSVNAGTALPVVATVRNSGWARLMNDRPLVIHLLDASGAKLYEQVLSAKELRWIGSNETRQIGSNIALPSSLKAGRYRIAISAPDAAASLSNKPMYAMRFANADQGEQTWDASRALMLTDAWVTLK